MSLQLFADRFHPRGARLALVGGGLHLDQLVGREAAVDLGHHGVGEALVADDDDGLQGVGEGAQFAAAGGGQRLRHGAIIPEFAGGRP